jgi:hypothetical protein
MKPEDIAEDSLRSCSQTTHYLLDWREYPFKPTKPVPLIKPPDKKP